MVYTTTRNNDNKMTRTKSASFLLFTWAAALLEVTTLFAAYAQTNKNTPPGGQWLDYVPLLKPTAAFVPFASSPIAIIGLPRRVEVVEHVGPRSAIATFHVELHPPALLPVRLRLRLARDNSTATAVHENGSSVFTTSSSNDEIEFIRNDFVGIETPPSSPLSVGNNNMRNRPTTYGAELRLRRPLDCQADRRGLHLVVVVRDSSSSSFSASQPISIVCRNADANVPKFFTSPQRNHPPRSLSLANQSTSPMNNNNNNNIVWRTPYARGDSDRSQQHDDLLYEDDPIISNSCRLDDADLDELKRASAWLPTSIVYMYITENNRVGEIIGRVAARVDDDDDDENSFSYRQRDNVHYFIIGSSWPNSVVIDRTNGILRANTVFDYEKLASIKLFIVAVSTDDVPMFAHGGQRKLSEALDLVRNTLVDKAHKHAAKAFSYQRVMVRIENVNDNPPRFVLDPYDVAVDARASAGPSAMPLSIIMSDDADDDAAAANCQPPIDDTIYDLSRTANVIVQKNQLMRSVSRHPFVINSTSGELLLAQSVQQFNQSYFVLQLYANQTNVALPPPSSSPPLSDSRRVSPLLYTLNGLRYTVSNAMFPASALSGRNRSLSSPAGMVVEPVQVLLPVVSTYVQLNIWIYDRASQLLTLEIDAPVSRSALGPPAIIPPLIARLGAMLDGRLAIGRIGPHRLAEARGRSPHRVRRQAASNTSSSDDASMLFESINTTTIDGQPDDEMNKLLARSLLPENARVIDDDDDDSNSDGSGPAMHNRSRTDVEVVLIVGDPRLRRFRILSARQVGRRLERLASTGDLDKIKAEFPAFVQLLSKATHNTIVTADDDGDNDESKLLPNTTTFATPPPTPGQTTTQTWLQGFHATTLTGTPLVLLIVVSGLLVLTVLIAIGLCCILCCAKYGVKQRRHRAATSAHHAETDGSAVVAINAMRNNLDDGNNSFLDSFGFVKPVYVAFNGFPPPPADGAPYIKGGAPPPHIALIHHHPGGPTSAAMHAFPAPPNFRRLSIAQHHQQQQQQHQYPLPPGPHSATTTIYAVGPAPPPGSSDLGHMQLHSSGSFLYAGSTIDNGGGGQQHIMLPHFDYNGNGHQHHHRHYHHHHPDSLPPPILVNAYPPDYFYNDPFAPMPALPLPPAAMNTNINNNSNNANTQYEEQSDTMTIGSGSSSQADGGGDSAPPTAYSGNNNITQHHARYYDQQHHHQQYRLNNGVRRDSSSGKNCNSRTDIDRNDDDEHQHQHIYTKMPSKMIVRTNSSSNGGLPLPPPPPPPVLSVPTTHEEAAEWARLENETSAFDSDRPR